MGVGPGSAFATFELAALVLASVQWVRQRNPQVHVSVHVDDFVFQRQDSTISGATVKLVIFA